MRGTGAPVRQMGVQEVDMVSIVDSITKYAVMVMEPEDIAYHLEKAALSGDAWQAGSGVAGQCRRTYRRQR